MSVLLNTLGPGGENIDFATMMSPNGKLAYEKYFKDCDLHALGNNSLSTPATNIYRCKDGRYFHVHGSMNTKPTQDMLGFPDLLGLPRELANPQEPWTSYQEKVAQMHSEEVQRLASDVYKQAGTICYSAEEYAESEHGKANAHIGLYEIHHAKNKGHKACWWPSTAETSAQRPLAGLRVVDLTRVIAAPAVARGLAELGASVMRITAEHITDMSNLHIDLNWGKWNASLDFRKEED
jgi:crotonobetainyl-CoA:carnitine CoA-transferase CaiB-like acyl-CoA transferase